MYTLVMAYDKTYHAAYWVANKGRIAALRIKKYEADKDKIQPRMRKFASVLPTRIVHMNLSGFSRNPWSNFAEGRPARAICRMRNRFNANTPASMPDSKNDSIRQTASATQLMIFVAII